MTHPAGGSDSGYWAVIPAHNEATTVRAVASATARHVRHVLVVDDGSTDGTSEALAGTPVQILCNDSNQGKAASLWKGFEAALEKGAHGVISLDADGQHDPRDIPRLLDAARRFPEHMVLGSRGRMRQGRPFGRYIGNRAADFWISWASGYPIEDTQSGFRVYPASLLKTVKTKHGQTRGFVFESEILIEAARQGCKTVSVSIRAIAPKGPRRSHFRPGIDVPKIIVMVAGKLLARGLYPIGLYRSLTGRTVSF